MRGLNTIAAGAALALAALAVLVAVVTPLDLPGQILFGAATICAGLLMRRRDSRRVTIALCLLSVAVSTRYIVWRTTETLDFPDLASGLFGWGLFLAELYAWLILVLGYVQTAAPLRRPVRPIEGPVETWPTIDVFV
ncbi:MAG TPA: hypothetical protein PKA17_11760, partial [Phenylobacterium sp.]|nr:hypothetical protein [Phenylobacterium sp.]